MSRPREFHPVLMGFPLYYFSTLKMEAVYHSETLVDLYRITQRYIPEGGIAEIRKPAHPVITILP
jgi:hypothetical protein